MQKILNLLLFTIFLCSLAWGQESPPIELAASDLSPAKKHAYYLSLISQFAGEPGGDEIWVLGLRGLEVEGRRHPSNLSSGAYTDTLVVVSSQKAMEFRAATHSGVARSAHRPWGVPQLKPGRYRAEPQGSRRSQAEWLLLNLDGGEALPVCLDRDGNGVICEAERELDEHYQSTAKDFRLQNGTHSDRPLSVGEQTLAPEDFPRFVEAVGARREFHYLLLDANAPQREESRDLRSLSHPLSPPDSFRFYERLAMKKGVEPGFPLLVIALRGVAPNGDRHASEENVGNYRDTFLLLRRQRDGTGYIRAFLGSTHAGQASSLRYPAVYAGVAQVRPGLYFARPNSYFHGLWSWHIVQHEFDHRGNLPAWRDWSKDGIISSEERWTAERAGVTANEILLHNGLDPDVGSSIGCFTMPPEVLVQFTKQVGSGSSFPFLVIDANE